LAAVTPDEVRALAAAARLDLPEERIEPVRAMLELILGETAELDELPLDGVAPLLDV
jgi:Asp-tRNA(Asn)/Glu-tRNA(Gln) amidotransferase C subunit